MCDCNQAYQIRHQTRLVYKSDRVVVVVVDVVVVVVVLKLSAP